MLPEIVRMELKNFTTTTNGKSFYGHLTQC